LAWEYNLKELIKDLKESVKKVECLALKMAQIQLRRRKYKV